MSAAALPLWTEAAPRRRASAAAGLPPLPLKASSASSWRHDALPSLRGFITLLLLAPLLSFAAFLAELAASLGAIPKQYRRGSGGTANVQALGGLGFGSGGDDSALQGPYSTDVIKLLSAVDKDFAPWERDGIDLEAVEQMYCEMQRDTFRLQVLDGRAYVVGEMKQYMTRQWHLKIQIQEMLDLWPGLIPDVDLVLYTDDIPPGWRGNPRPCHKQWGPLLTLNKLYVSNSHWNRAHEFAIMNPCNTMGGFPESRVGSWRQMRAKLSAAAANVSWADREPRLLFRGGRTSPERIMIYENEGVLASPLVDIAEASGDNPNAAGRKELEDHCSYKYLLHLQGNTYATRLKWLLACGSVVLFPVDPEYFHQEFWYHMLEDGVNIRFLPPVTPENNGSHLVEAVQWLEGHPEEAERIAQGARRLIDEVLTADNVLLYWRALFTKYGSLMNFKVELHPDAVPLESSIAIGRNYAWPDCLRALASALRIGGSGGMGASTAGSPASGSALSRLRIQGPWLSLWWECPRFRTCGRVCPLWPDRPIAPHVFHAPPFPFEGSTLSEFKCLADMFYGM